MPEGKVFLDTNILIYAYDNSAGDKHDTAKGIVEELWDEGTGMLSIQVLQEFFVNITQKIARPLDAPVARDVIADLLKWEVVVNDGDTLLGGVDLRLRYSYSFWDSMILYAAISGGAKMLLTEDLADGQVVEGVTIHNPFALKLSAGSPRDS